MSSIDLKEEYINMLPSFHLLLRDFKHVIVEKGVVIPAHNYFEKFLFDDLSILDASF